VGSKSLVDFEMVSHWASQIANHWAALCWPMYFPDMLLDSMKNLDDFSTLNCMSGHTDHSFVVGRQHSTVDFGCL